MRERQGDEEAAKETAEEENESGGVLVGITNLSIETAGTQEEAEEGLVAALKMEVEEDRGSKGSRERKRVEGLKGHWEPISSSLRNLSREELRSLMTVMGSMS